MERELMADGEVETLGTSPDRAPSVKTELQDRKPEASLTADFIQRGRDLMLARAEIAGTQFPPGLVPEPPATLPGEAVENAAPDHTDFRRTVNHHIERDRSETGAGWRDVAVFMMVFVFGVATSLYALGLAPGLVDWFLGVPVAGS